MPFRCCTVTPGLAKISESTIRRLSLYLRILEELEGQGTPTASSCALADRGGTTAAQVRKDLSLFGSFGKRGVGYSVGQLATQLRDILGLSRTWRVALVGAGRIGSALLEYEGFRRRGFRIVAVVDSDKDKVGRHWNGLVVRDQSELEDVVRREDVEIVILAVPARAVQDIVDRAVAAGVRGVLNFAPTQPRIPEGVALNHVDVTVELEALSFALSQMEEH